MSDDTFRLANLRITVIAIEGRSVCGLSVGDYFEVTNSSQVRIPEGKHFCLFAMASVQSFLPAMMRKLDSNDWMTKDTIVACPDADERVIMRIEHIGEATLHQRDLT